MRDITDHILELIRLTSTNLPSDVEARLREAHGREAPGSAARGAMEAILSNVETTRRNSTPICQDTGTPIFFVQYHEEWQPGTLKKQIRQAVELATQQSYLRPNSVDSLTGINSGNNLGDQYFPVIHLTESSGDILVIDLILKGGGCENVGAQYSLPDDRLKAGRDLDGVRKVVLDAVYRAQGEGCSPGFLGVAIGGDRATSYMASKEVLLRRVDTVNPNPELAALEDRLTGEANQLGIGPMGFGGSSTVLATKIMATSRLPASFFVTISYMCWAYRHRRMVVTFDKILFE